jgi:hypothetical protein
MNVKRDRTAEIYCSNLERMNALARQLRAAMDLLAPIMPLREQDFDADKLEPTTSLALDGFRARFSDLQDMLGKSMFKSLARMDQEETPENELSTRERMMLMEKRGILDVERWNQAREIRNAFTHDYPDHPAEKAANYNAAWEYSHYLLEVVANIQRYSASHYGSLACD